MSARLYQSLPSSLKGFVLLPIVMAISLIAAIVYLTNREAAMNINILGGEIATTEALYAAKAGLNHMLWQLDQSGCSGYSNIGPTAFGNGSYSVTVTPTSGSPVSITATGTHPSGASYTIKRDGVNAGHGPIQTKVIQPAAATATDTYISFTNQTTNYGASSSLIVSQRSGNNQRSLLQYDLSRFTAETSIVSANLSLYQTSIGSTGGLVSIHKVSGNWGEMEATWNNRNTSASWTTPGGDFDAQTVASATISGGVNAWYSWDITTLVQGWVSESYANNGMILKMDSAGSDAVFYGSDGGGTFIPKITVSYNCPCGVECYSSVPPVTVTLNPVADAFIDSLNASKNYGATNSLNIQYTNATSQKRSVLKFDISSIPTGSLIQNAKLRLYAGSMLSPSTFPKSVSAYAVTQSWIQGSKTGTGPADGVTWSTRNGSIAWTTAGGDYLTPSVAGAVEESSGISPPPASFTSGWLNWDLKAVTQEWVDGVAANNGVILISTVTDGLVIDSKEKGGSTIPQLSVTYQP